MDNVNKTLYIPLFGKAYVSRRGLFIKDEMAEKIWEAEGFTLRGKARSKWLAFYMGIRAAVFDEWVRESLSEDETAIVIHVGCGMDGRALRVGIDGCRWYDVDFPQVIEERKKYYIETDNYKMLAGDVRDPSLLDKIPAANRAVVVMEGVSMYLTEEELRGFFSSLSERFPSVSLLTDCYTTLAARLSGRGNPVKEVGVTQVYGLDDPRLLESGLCFVREREMTPRVYIEELSGIERGLFARLYAGGLSRKLYRLYEYGKDANGD